jgi:hypothetical protein
MGCAWLIRRRIDADAAFLFIPYGTNDLPADAEPFDIPGARLSHHGGHCSFYALLAAYDLHDPVLDRIARMIDEVDTVQELEFEPAAPGIDLLCRGLRRISPDDQTALDRGALLYEALYSQLASEGLQSAKSIVQPRGDRDRGAREHDAIARWEDEGGAPPLDEST